MKESLKIMAAIGAAISIGILEMVEGLAARWCLSSGEEKSAERCLACPVGQACNEVSRTREINRLLTEGWKPEQIPSYMFD